MPVAAFGSGSPRAPAATSHPSKPILLAAAGLLGVIGLLKGLGSDIVNDVDYYWMITYEHGFIRRGLVGTLFHPLLASSSFDDVRRVVLGLHVAACLWIMFVCYALFRRAMESETRPDVAMTLLTAFVFLMCSPFWQSMAYLVGYLDPYVIVLAVTAFWLVLKDRYVAAAVVAAVGPAIHEAFVFMWAPVAIMLVSSCAAGQRHVHRKLLAALLPMLTATAVVMFHDQRAVRLSIAALPVAASEKSRALFQLELTVSRLLDHMFRVEYPGHLLNVAMAAVYCLIPTAGLLWATAFVSASRTPHRKKAALLAVAAAASPLPILVLVWDLSRFLLWSNLAAAMVLAGSTSAIGGVWGERHD